MTQKETVLSLLRQHRRVTLRMLGDAGVIYTARNRVSELRKEGYMIQQENGETPSDNAYILVSEPVRVEVDNFGQRVFA